MQKTKGFVRVVIWGTATLLVLFIFFALTMDLIYGDEEYPLPRAGEPEPEWLTREVPLTGPRRIGLPGTDASVVLFPEDGEVLLVRNGDDLEARGVLGPAIIQRRPGVSATTYFAAEALLSFEEDTSSPGGELSAIDRETLRIVRSMDGAEPFESEVVSVDGKWMLVRAAWEFGVVERVVSDDREALPDEAGFRETLDPESSGRSS